MSSFRRHNFVGYLFSLFDAIVVLYDVIPCSRRDWLVYCRSALGEASPPCIPYIGLVLQDLTFVHIGNPDTIEDRINFAKRWQQFNILVGNRRVL
jgi:hypothetical protein